MYPSRFYLKYSAKKYIYINLIVHTTKLMGIICDRKALKKKI